MYILSQQDPRWAKIKLGDSTCSVGRYGCTTTSIAMATSWAGCYKDPGVLAKTIEYTDEGLIKWDSINKACCLKFYERGYAKDPEKIRNAIRSPYAVCLLEVNHNHWVLATGLGLLGTYKIADPWYGDRATTRRYNNNITGFAILNK